MHEYEYEFVRVEVSTGIFGRSASGDYKEIVHERAKQGWRLAHVLSSATNLPAVVPVGKLVCELVFERIKR
jgi:hypothetical protein